MFVRTSILMVILAFVILGGSTACAQPQGWKMVHGDVLQVFPEQHKILLKSGGEQLIYELESSCQILRLGVTTTLNSMRPIGPEAFQDALCWIDATGLVALILVNYSVEERNGTLIAYDIFGNLK